MKKLIVGQVWKNDQGETIVITETDIRADATTYVAEYVKFPPGKKYRGPQRKLKRAYPHYLKMVYEK